MRGLSDLTLDLGATILAVVALWHMYWALGGRVGLAQAIPERHGRPAFTPRPSMTVAIAILVAVVAAVYAVAGTEVVVWQHVRSLVAIALAGAGSVFVARAIGDFTHVGFFNRGAGTRFGSADRLVFSPICLFLGLTGLGAAALRLL